MGSIRSMSGRDADVWYQKFSYNKFFAQQELKMYLFIFTISLYPLPSPSYLPVLTNGLWQRCNIAQCRVPDNALSLVLRMISGLRNVQRAAKVFYVVLFVVSTTGLTYINLSSQP